MYVQSLKETGNLGIYHHTMVRQYSAALVIDICVPRDVQHENTKHEAFV